MGRTRRESSVTLFPHINSIIGGYDFIPYLGKEDYCFLISGNGRLGYINSKLKYEFLNYTDIKYVSPWGDVIDSKNNHYVIRGDELVFVKKIPSRIRISYFDGRGLCNDERIEDLETGEFEERKGVTHPYNPCYYIYRNGLYHDDQKIASTSAKSFDHRLYFDQHFEKYLENPSICYDNQGNYFHIVDKEIRFQRANQKEMSSENFTLPSRKADIIEIIKSIDKTIVTERKTVDELKKIFFGLRLNSPKHVVIDIRKDFKEGKSLLLLSRGVLLCYNKGIIDIYDVDDFLLRMQIKNIQESTKDDEIRKMIEVVYLNL